MPQNSTDQTARAYIRTRPWRHRGTRTLFIDGLCAFAAMAIAVGVRYSFDPRDMPQNAQWWSGATFGAMVMVTFALARVHRAVWRYTSLGDLWRVAKATFFAILLFLPVLFFFNRLNGFPRSSLAIGVPLFLFMAMGGRLFVYMLAHDGLRGLMRSALSPGEKAVLIGAGEGLGSAVNLARSAASGPMLDIIGIIAADDQFVGQAIEGVPVLSGRDGMDDVIASLVQAHGHAPVLAFTDPPNTRLALDLALVAAGKWRAPLARLAARDHAARFLPASPADLLARPPRQVDPSIAAQLIEGRRVLVTGAGGSIGAELVRQIASLRPASLALFEASERNLYEIDQDLRVRHPDLVTYAMLGDVRSEARVLECFHALSPEVVIHAAALKHVPLMELNPCEAVLTNIGGTMVVAKAASETRVRAFVLVSTDKAVFPSNVMGATKRLAEIYVRSLALANHHKGWAAVRFGNVLGSAGSVLPLFEAQISRGGPVTVTHPDITRYFMSIEEAASLVLSAGGVANYGPETQQGGLYILEMGEPVKILDLARSLIRLKGLEPDADIGITFTGLRPGEKLHEQVLYPAETVSPTMVEGVLCAQLEGCQISRITSALQDLLSIAASRDDLATRSRLMELVSKAEAPLSLDAQAC